MNIGIIGCGLIGKKRSKQLGKHKLRGVADSSIEKAFELASGLSGIRISSDWHDIVRMNDIDIIIVSTPNYLLAPIALEAIEHSKHVIIEKPCAINSKEIETLIEAQKKTNVKVCCGYNHRYHPAFLKAKEIIESTDIGNLFYVQSHYGHGGRVGYDKEWRANPMLAGGGDLIDKGVHVIDLARWFLGEFTAVNGFTHTYFWSMPVEDNAFLYLETTKGQVAQLHVSSTSWKNTFLFEITGERGTLKIEGLGGSYGTERLTYYRMRPGMGPPETTIWEYSFPDKSFELELSEFVNSVRNDTEPECNLHDALETMKIVEKIYKINTTRGKT